MKGGRLLAWLVREQSASMSVPSLVDRDGVRQTSSRAIASYYTELYSSRVDYSMEDLHIYLSDVDFPVLTETYGDQLDSPITLQEVHQAISSLQAGKTPGPDRFPTEFYRMYAEELAPKFHSMLLVSLRDGILPASMSYHPISLINVDAKILAKILATRLSRMITALVHPDQSGFMPGRGTDINFYYLPI